MACQAFALDLTWTWYTTMATIYEDRDTNYTSILSMHRLCISKWPMYICTYIIYTPSRLIFMHICTNTHIPIYLLGWQYQSWLWWQFVTSGLSVGVSMWLTWLSLATKMVPKLPAQSTQPVARLVRRMPMQRAYDNNLYQTSMDIGGSIIIELRIMRFNLILICIYRYICYLVIEHSYGGSPFSSRYM